MHVLRRQALHLSLGNPHPETGEVEALGLNDWADGLPDEDAAALLDFNQGKPACWIQGEGWAEEPRNPRLSLCKPLI